MRDTVRGQRRAAAPWLAAGCAAILLLSGCTTYDAPHSDDKVPVCHDGDETLMLPDSAVDEHLGHGDSMGPC